MDDLRRSLDGIGLLVLSPQGLPKLLEEVATLASCGIPHAYVAGVTVFADRGDHRIEGLGFSHPVVAEIKKIQFTIVSEGPCLTAALERRTMRSGSLGGEKQWPRFGPRVGRLGLHSVMSVPLVVADRVIGGVSVYAQEKDIFDDHAVEFGELFATVAAVAVRNAQILTRTLALTAQLQRARQTRPVIDQAIGLLRARSGDTPDEVFDRLRAISQREHTKLSIVAQHIVDEAVSRARSRHTQAHPG